MMRGGAGGGAGAGPGHDQQAQIISSMGSELISLQDRLAATEAARAQAETAGSGGEQDQRSLRVRLQISEQALRSATTALEEARAEAEELRATMREEHQLLLMRHRADSARFLLRVCRAHPAPVLLGAFPVHPVRCSARWLARLLACARGPQVTGEWVIATTQVVRTPRSCRRRARRRASSRSSCTPRPRCGNFFRAKPGRRCCRERARARQGRRRGGGGGKAEFNNKCVHRRGLVAVVMCGHACMQRTLAQQEHSRQQCLELEEAVRDREAQHSAAELRATELRQRLARCAGGRCWQSPRARVRMTSRVVVKGGG
jgi:hypothetical protein